jgi:hypothetical protein
MRTLEMKTGIHRVFIFVEISGFYHRLRQVTKLGALLASEYAVKKR